VGIKRNSERNHRVMEHIFALRAETHRREIIKSQYRLYTKEFSADNNICNFLPYNGVMVSFSTTSEY